MQEKQHKARDHSFFFFTFTQKTKQTEEIGAEEIMCHNYKTEKPVDKNWK